MLFSLESKWQVTHILRLAAYTHTHIQFVANASLLFNFCQTHYYVYGKGKLILWNTTLSCSKSNTVYCILCVCANMRHAHVYNTMQIVSAEQVTIKKSYIPLI